MPITIAIEVIAHIVAAVLILFKIFAPQPVAEPAVGGNFRVFIEQFPSERPAAPELYYQDIDPGPGVELVVVANGWDLFGRLSTGDVNGARALFANCRVLPEPRRSAIDGELLGEAVSIAAKAMPGVKLAWDNRHDRCDIHNHELMLALNESE